MTLWTDHLPLAEILSAQRATAGTPSSTTTSRDSQDRFWSTVPRPEDDPTREVLEITFNDQRLINHLSLEVAHFPHVVTAEYQDLDTRAWRPFLSAASSIAAPVTYSITDSAPALVGVLSAKAYQHPQHFGPGHWQPVVWRVKAVTTRVVRFVFERTAGGTPPVDVRRQKVPYSLGARSIQVGYRITSKADIPRYGDVYTFADDFASSTDLLGSRVVYSLREDAARNVLSPVDGVFWRSDPQPVNYAVVNFYVDTRDADGAGQVIDRFYIDPLTVGAHMNVYYSNEEPEGSFRASDQPLNYPVVQQHGLTATAQRYPQFSNISELLFSHIYPSYVDIDNAYLQWHAGRTSWWLGIEIRNAFFGRDGDTAVVGQDDEHPIVSFGSNVLRTVPGAVELTNEFGQVASVALDPDHRLGAIWRVVLVYNEQATEDYPPGLTMIYQIGDLEPVVEHFEGWQRPSVRPGVFRIGGYPDTNDPGVPGFGYRALILKPITADATDVAGFLADSQAYVARPAFVADEDGSTDNSILRLDPSRADATVSPVGLFGGPGDRYGDLVWTPIFRDYRLKRGHLHLPPTRAKYWKFEFTGLIAQPYEVFVPMRREFKIFATNTVRDFYAMQAPSDDPRDGGPGVKAMLDLAEVNRYADALAALRSLPSNTQHSPTEVLYAANPTEAQRIQGFGWVWGFQPWHTGAHAPKFITRGRHIYETVVVDHRAKVAYFAGIKRLQAYRVDYLADDDVEQYLDLFDDLEWVESITTAEQREGALFSLSGYAEITSKTMASHRLIRAVQFASSQSDGVQILPDDDFSGSDFGTHWEVYGDAEVEPGLRRVEVLRGWQARTYGDIESTADFDTYSEVEERLYAELEGAQPDGVAGGGIQSKPLDPSGSGRIHAAVKVSAPEGLQAPLVVQIVSSVGNDVLAETEVPPLAAGQEASFYTSYTVGSASTPLTWGELEAVGTYGDIEGDDYGEHESVAITGAVFARVAQVGPTTDRFVVHRLSLFDEPIQWAFSVDGGATWYDAFGVRNNTNGVLTLPVPGKQLKWRARIFREGAWISALAIRPWYAGLLGSMPSNHGMSVSGPNQSVVDQYPHIERDPWWRQWDKPVPRWWYLNSPEPLPAPAPGTETPEPEEPPAAVPTVSLGVPTDVDPTSAVPIGAVNPNGLDTAWSFEYGLTSGYGSSTVPQVLDAGHTTLPVYALIEGLVAETTYHYRLVATNTLGTSVTLDAVFITPAAPV